MGTEQLFKLQPDRTLYLRGFTGVGAAASLHDARPDGFTVSGVFRDMADFCVLNVYDADNTFEHYSVRSLPDFDLSGLTLTFDVSYRGLQPLDSAKYSWIDWSMLDVIKEDKTAERVRLWDNATLIGGNYSVASGSCTFSTGPNGCVADEKIVLFVNNAQFVFEAKGGEPAEEVARQLKELINQYPWWKFENSSVSVIASSDNSGKLTLKNARTGTVQCFGNNIYFSHGIRFAGIASGSQICLDGGPFTVASVNGPTSMSLTSVTTTLFTEKHYLAEYGGLDGNEVKAYVLVGRDATNPSLNVDRNIIALSGGNSDDVVWRISIDFSHLEINRLRQAWLTFAPQLANSTEYHDTEWVATFSNWNVQGPAAMRQLKCATTGSMRVDSEEPSTTVYNKDSDIYVYDTGSGSCVYKGTWQTESANNLQYGFARSTKTLGDSVTLIYTQAVSHDLYLGTSLGKDRLPVDISVDGGTAVRLDCGLDTDAELITRRLVCAAVTAGTHTVTIAVAASGTTDGSKFLFDYLEAAIPGDFPDACVTYDNVSPALDFDTDATYKVSPQRLMWHLQKLGFRGQLNEYLGVFWWNQRKRASGYQTADKVTKTVRWEPLTVTFGSSWSAGQIAELRIGGKDGFTMRKTATPLDTPDTIASHFVHYLNATSVSMWAEKAAASGALMIHLRTPIWSDLVDAGDGSASADVTIAGLDENGRLSGEDGIWIIDADASNPINFPCREWHLDLFKEVKEAGLQITAGFSMELVYPPDPEDDQEGHEWQARYSNGEPVRTDVKFSNLVSSHCAPIVNFTNYQKSAYKVLAGLQADAGLTPWLQFGEFLWWFFSYVNKQVGYCGNVYPVNIGVADHGLSTGDKVAISDVAGCPAANGVWTIAVTGKDNFTIPTGGDGEWKSGTGWVRGGSMAYYDSVTKGTARAALGRPLAEFVHADQDPSANGEDVHFLQARLKDHVDAIRQEVLVSYPQAKFELLFPNDVNNKAAYMSRQGGRLNAAVNLPPEWMQNEGSGFDRFKVEALSWSADYYNLGLAEEAIVFASTAPMKWAYADTAYLVPWFRGICPWPAEYHLAKDFVPLVNFWAYDHLSLMSWPLPFPTHGRRATFLG